MNRWLISTALTLAVGGVAQAGVTERDIADDQSITTQVVTNGMGRDLQRFSPLKRIHTGNIDKLTPACSPST